MMWRLFPCPKSGLNDSYIPVIAGQKCPRKHAGMTACYFLERFYGGKMFEDHAPHNPEDKKKKIFFFWNYYKN
jgi:hypothetical protein